MMAPTQGTGPSASVGITVSSNDGAEAEVMLQDADLAMFFAKGQGDVRYAMFEERMAGSASSIEMEAASRCQSWSPCLIGGAPARNPVRNGGNKRK